jgi:hypothetical protein
VALGVLLRGRLAPSLTVLGVPLPVAPRPPRGSAIPSRASITKVSEKPVRAGRRDSSKKEGLGLLPEEPLGAAGWAIAPIVPNPTPNKTPIAPLPKRHPQTIARLIAIALITNQAQQPRQNFSDCSQVIAPACTQITSQPDHHPD